MRFWIKSPLLAAMALALAVVFASAQEVQEYPENRVGDLDRERPAESIGPVTFTIDTGVFNSGTGLPVVEIYLEVPYDELPFVRKGAGYVSRIEIIVVFLSRSGEQVGGDTWNRDLWVKDYDETIDPQKSYRALARFEMPPGQYDLKLSCGALGSNTKGDAYKRIQVPEPPSEGLSLSDVRMGVCSVETAVGDDVKDSFVPSGNRAFGGEIPLICVLAEAYSLAGVDAESLEVEAYAKNESGGVVWSDSLSVEISGRETLVAFRVPTDSLAWGTYKLTLDARAGDYEASVSRWFEADETRFGISMDQEMFLELMSIFANEEELETLASLGGSERKAYLEEIWRRRDPDRSTPRNEFKTRFFRRLKDANARFAEPGREGWQTDRGRVFIKNGPPDRIDTRRGVYGSLSPHARLEVWYYDATNIHYVFEDFGGTGQFTLVDVVQG